MVGEAVVVSATHGGLYLLIHCSIAQWAHSGRVFWLNKYTQYTHWTKKPEFTLCALVSTLAPNMNFGRLSAKIFINAMVRWFINSFIAFIVGASTSRSQCIAMVADALWILMSKLDTTRARSTVRQRWKLILEFEFVFYLPVGSFLGLR